MAENKMAKVESLLTWLVSGEKDEDGNWLSDDDTQLVCDALEYYLNMHGQKNKMEQVAALFGKRLGEEFVMRFGKDMYRARFDRERGFIYQDIPTYQENWSTNSAFLRLLLTGQAEIVEDE